MEMCFLNHTPHTHTSRDETAITINNGTTATVGTSYFVLMLSPPIRWSLRSLSQLPWNPDTARTILTDVAHRLANQQVRLQHLLNDTTTTDTNKDVRHLQYIHKDTERICRQLLVSPLIVQQRWTKADRNLVSATLAQVRDRHATALERLVDSVVIQQQQRTDNADHAHAIEQQAQQILQARWGIQLLCDHAVQLQLQKQQKQDDNDDRHKNSKQQQKRGAVSVHCPLQHVIQDAITEAQHICDAHWMVVPPVLFDDIHGSFLETNETTIPALTLIRPWVHHTLVELLKNALHAAVQANREEPPPLVVQVSTVSSFVHVDILDNGIGLPSSTDIEPLFRLGHSSDEKRWDRLDEQQSYATVRSPMSSLGVGLAVSRSMMQHFGGHVQLFSSSESSAQAATATTTARVSLPVQDDLLERANQDEESG